MNTVLLANLNENDDTNIDAEEIPYPRKKGFNITYEEFNIYKDFKRATQYLCNLGWIKGKWRKEKKLFRC